MPVCCHCSQTPSRLFSSEDGRPATPSPSRDVVCLSSQAEISVSLMNSTKSFFFFILLNVLKSSHIALQHLLPNVAHPLCRPYLLRACPWFCPAFATLEQAGHAQFLVRPLGCLLWRLRTVALRSPAFLPHPQLLACYSAPLGQHSPPRSSVCRLQ